MIDNFIFYENPIARFYLNLFIQSNYSLKTILVLTKIQFFRGSIFKAQFNKNNFGALKFLQDKEIIYLTKTNRRIFLLS